MGLVRRSGSPSLFACGFRVNLRYTRCLGDVHAEAV